MAEELPMQPITMMRNAHGAEYGGSGVELDLTAYQASVEFWSIHARGAVGEEGGPGVGRSTAETQEVGQVRVVGVLLV